MHFDAPLAPTDERHIGKFVYALCRWILREIQAAKFSAFPDIRRSAAALSSQGEGFICSALQYSTVVRACVPCVSRLPPVSFYR